MTKLKEEMEITDKNFQQQVLEADKPVLVMFWGSWCPVCKRTQPLLEELGDKWDQIKVKAVNIDRNPEASSEYRIAGTPTFYLFENGRTKGMKVGAVTTQQLEEFVSDNLNN